MTITVVVTGATGSFGSAFIPYLLEKTDYDVVGISRNEAMQGLLAAAVGSDRLRLVPCDIRDTRGLERALWRYGADWVVHAAALKRVPNSYEHIQEYADVNINGTASLLEVTRRLGSNRLLYISSDKACDAHNPYGATKRVAEALVLAANEAAYTWWDLANNESKFTLDKVDEWCPAFATAVVRGGNVWDSGGSVMQLWRRQADAGEPITVTDPTATRFHLPMGYWCEFVLHWLRGMAPGRVCVPRLRAYHMGELAHAFLATAKAGSYVKVVGPRRGDKRHEYLVSPSEAIYTEAWEHEYVIHQELPQPWGWKNHPTGGVRSANAKMLTADELSALVRSH